jgi:hypothetical protein
VALGRKTGGRQKGVLNKATASLKELARVYAPECVETLIGLVRASDSDAARVSAIKELLDRGYGKASLVINGDEDGGPVQIEQVGWNVRDT